MALLIAFLTFCVAAPAFFMLWLLFGPTTNPAMVRRRMEAVQSAERSADVALAHLQLIRDESLSGVPLLNRLMLRLSWSRRLQDLITQAGMRTRPGQILLFSGVLGLATYLFVGLVFGGFGVAILLALIAAASPVLVVARRRQKRLQEFEKRFPEALDLLGRAVRAGHAFTTGIEMVSTDTTEPVAGEFRTTFEEQNFGLPLRDALLNLAQRVPLVDVRFFVTALLVQKETGGNLAELLDELARVIRERFRIRRDVQVKTAQGRLTAAILIALPIAMLLIMRILNPTYVRVLFEDPLGPKLLAGAAALQAVGSLILWKIVHIEV
jgi:tight adherence protein B